MGGHVSFANIMDLVAESAKADLGVDKKHDVWISANLLSKNFLVIKKTDSQKVGRMIMFSIMLTWSLAGLGAFVTGRVWGLHLAEYFFAVPVLLGFLHVAFLRAKCWRLGRSETSHRYPIVVFSKRLAAQADLKVILSNFFKVLVFLTVVLAMVFVMMQHGYYWVAMSVLLTCIVFAKSAVLMALAINMKLKNK